MKKEKSDLLYFYDALCGWCYGFSPVIHQIKKNYQSNFDFRIISGGLKVGEGVGPIGVVAPYIKAGAYKTVEERCGVKFGEDFVNGPLETGDMRLNSLPPAIALSIVKKQKPEEAFEFGSILHKAVYVDGHHPEDLDGYGKYAEKIGLDGVAFVETMKDPIAEGMAQEDFQLARKFGINGFPTLVGIKENKAYLISNGYMDYEAVAARLEAF